jgi:hypothetical protein
MRAGKRSEWVLKEINRLTLKSLSDGRGTHLARVVFAGDPVFGSSEVRK